MSAFTDNLGKMWGHISTYVALGASTGAAAWLNLDPATQAGVLAAVPALKVAAPVVSFVAFAVAKGIPQTPKDPDPKAGP